jgi:hypothetical protein
VPSRNGCVPEAPDDGHKIHAGAALDPVPDAGVPLDPVPDVVADDAAPEDDVLTPLAEAALDTPDVAVEVDVPPAGAADDAVCAAAGPASANNNASAMQPCWAVVGLPRECCATGQRFSTKRGGPHIGLPSASSLSFLTP